jgi:mannose-6-phosphate isomerase-like protein (cupin superfamily)
MNEFIIFLFHFKKGEQNMFKKNLSSPDEIRTPSKTRVEVVNLEKSVIMRATFEPGWKWSECVKPVAGTDSCMVHHSLYVISGRMAVKMNDGNINELGPGDAAEIPPGHDAWVLGNEPCVSIDFAAGKEYAK